MLVVAATLALLPSSSQSPSTPSPRVSILGDVETLLGAYGRWKAAYVRNGGDQKLSLPLAYSRGLSVEATQANGTLTLDLANGTVVVEVSGLPLERFDVWLLGHRPQPGRDLPEARDGMIRVGRLRHEQRVATLRAQLGQEVLADFTLVRAAVARAGHPPGAAGLLFGSPGLFQRLYYSEQRGESLGLGEVDEPHGPPPRPSLLAAPFRALIPGPAHAGAKGAAPDIRTKLQALVARGEFLFFNETFAGNGRTCGTCHRAENNFTIDADFIATLPPTDPLFVAEFNPALAQLERPELLRKFGLILANVDGFDDLPSKFVMRGVPHLLSLSSSIASGSTVPPLQRTGWGGDGAPGNGTLREFAIGAVRQHLTKTLNRTDGVDFRSPNDAELDALEAFQLSLGRHADLSLPLPLKDPRARLGQDIYLDDNLGRCNLCHANAGATAAFSHFPLGINENFVTGVEDLPRHPARQVAPNMPRDGGFGITPSGDGRGGLGDGSFSTPPLVEAAATGPFFHNNAIHTIEEAVNFYTSETYNNSASGTQVRIQLTQTQVLAVAAFLRVISTQEKIRMAIGKAKLAKLESGEREADGGLGIARAEIGHAIRVLEAGKLHASATVHLKVARHLLAVASDISFGPVRNILINLAVNQLDIARGHIVE